MSSIGVEEFHELQAEQSVLGAIFLRPECLDEISFLEPRDFSSEKHELIYRVMQYLYRADKPVDIVTVAEHFQRRNRLEDMGSVAYLLELQRSCPSAANVEHYARLVRSKALGRRIAEKGRQIASLSRDDFESDEEYFATVEEMIDELRPQQSIGMRSFGETKQEYMQHLRSKAGKMLSGFDQFDRWSQLWRGWLYVLAGRPSVGKTAKALQLAIGVARQRQGEGIFQIDAKDAGVVLIFSQEMDEDELKDRMVANISGVSYNRIINKGGEDGFTEEEWKKIERAYSELESLPIYIQDKAAVTIEEIRATARRFKKKYGKIALIIVDYLQIMHIPQKPGERRDQAIGRVTGMAKQIARKLDCCFLLLSQMTRDSENSEEPKLSHLKESGSIEQDADVVEFLWHNPDDTEQGGKVIQSVFAKGRNVGTNKFRYLFQGWLQRFKELEKKEVTKSERKNWPKNRK
ncbi:DnaB-like helicase C-terminal domain-containing protein [Paenibacillus cisolokensis]|uniref:replicative DNA helicase n=1 Tax=Paenibacillus cisolokensis TaxID=1658519 RepID=UPI003D27EC9D